MDQDDMAAGIRDERYEAGAPHLQDHHGLPGAVYYPSACYPGAHRVVHGTGARSLQTGPPPRGGHGGARRDTAAGHHRGGTAPGASRTVAPEHIHPVGARQPVRGARYTPVRAGGARQPRRTTPRTARRNTRGPPPGACGVPGISPEPIKAGTPGLSPGGGSAGSAPERTWPHHTTTTLSRGPSRTGPARAAAKPVPQRIFPGTAAGSVSR